MAKARLIDWSINTYFSKKEKKLVNVSETGRRASRTPPHLTFPEVDFKGQ